MNADDVKAWLRKADRTPLRQLVGERAESLVHQYGACDRSRTWRTLPGTSQVWNRWTGRPDYLLQGFADLSIVNELDVVEQDPTLGQRYGGYFRDVFASWQGLASEPVLAEARRVLGP
ncbi:DUF6817 domain-containing protein [Actinoplanes sp. NPDC051475]|uniref:DUF6817 domain-containing protein n=1 Tax=Actinoplanes sp. NPDC051475 TaxID=3157225 RepID=UPI00344F61DC